MNVLVVVLILFGISGLVRNILKIVYDIKQHRKIDQSLDCVVKEYQTKIDYISKRHTDC